MNDLIRKLELEAIAYADSKVPANNRYNDIYHSIVRGKFADLIVKECANYALEKGIASPDTDFRTGSLVISEFLLARFGVE